MSEKTPISNFLNGLSKKVRETEQKITTPKQKRNWDNESTNTQPKDFKEFDVQESLSKMNKKLESFSSTVSEKFSETVSHLNDRLNEDIGNDSYNASVDDSDESQGQTTLDELWIRTTMPDGSIGYTSAGSQRSQEKSAEQQRISERIDNIVESSETVEKPSNVYDIFGKKNASSETKYVDVNGGLKKSQKIDEDIDNTSTLHNGADDVHNEPVYQNYLNVLNEKYHKHIKTPDNAKRMNDLMDSFNNGLHKISEKYNETVNNVKSSEDINDFFGTSSQHDVKPIHVNGKSIASGSEMLSLLSNHRSTGRPTFGVVVDEDNDNNALMMAIVAARNLDLEFLNIDVANSMDNDLADRKADKAFDRVQNFLSEKERGLITVDARELANDNVRMIIEFLYHETEKRNFTVLVLTNDVEDLPLNNDSFDEKFRGTVVIDY